MVQRSDHYASGVHRCTSTSLSQTIWLEGNTMRTRKVRTRLVAGIAALTMVVAACSGSSDDPSDSSDNGSGSDSQGTEPDNEAESPEETKTGDDAGTGESGDENSGDELDAPSFSLRTGVIVPLTGDQSSLGPGYAEATRMAVDMVNESIDRLGLSDQLEMILTGVEDDQTEARAGVEAATKLVQVDDVDVIFGSVATAVTVPIAESVAIPEGVVLISMGSTAPSVTDLDDDDYVWRTVPSAASQGPAIANVVEQELGPDAVIATGARNDDFSISLISLFEKEWTDRGNTLGASVRWNPDAPTLDTEAAQLVADNPDGWVIIDFPEGWGKTGPSLVRTGKWDPNLTFTAQSLQDETMSETVGREATEGLSGVSPASEEAPMFGEFVKIFEERAEPGTVRQGFAPYAFDSPFLAFLAALRAGSSDPALIKENLQAVSGPPGAKYTFMEFDDAIRAVLAGEDVDYEGAGGPVDFDDAGDPGQANFQRWKFVDGSIEVLEVLR